ncbi:MAG: hypothetical protein EOP46_03740 [Sphingobacteriaceae bacterium]|nr:MAG: hypothetical protein EOP46_03740 [Sphingobacteriaceae bacterium]
MEYHPPIATRTNEQLMEIVVGEEQWQPEVVSLAKTELQKRGISTQIQQATRKRKNSYQKRIAAIKAKASYSNTEKVLIILIGPLAIILLKDLLLFHTGEGYINKNKQGLICTVLGLLLWVLVGYLSLR